VVRRSRWLNAVSVIAPPHVVRTIGRLPFVVRTAPVRGGRSVPATPAGRTQAPGAGRDVFDYGPSLNQLAQIDVPAAHEAGYSGAGVIVAMLDTGYRHDHPAFASIVADGRLLAQWDFIDEDGQTQNQPGDPDSQDFHGTATWSALGGFAEGELIGPAYGASFLLAKTEDVSQEVPAEEDDWVAAAEWADQLGADVISSSLSYIDWYTYEDMDGNTAVTTIAADVAASRGIVVCVSAGNQGTQDWYYIGAPADADTIVTVGAVRPDGEMWDQSSHGPTYDGRIKPEVVAQGDETVAAVPPGSIGGNPDALYWTLSGTSMSAPLVAGCAALVLEAHPDWTPVQVREALMLTADNADAPDNHRGWGLVDVLAAIAFGPTAAPASAIPVPRLTIWPNPGRSRIFLGVAGSAGSAGEISVYSLAGRLVTRDRVGDGTGFVWDGRDEHGGAAPSGMYLVEVKAGGRRVTGKLTLQR